MDGQTLPVNEIFETVQGEATFTGTPAIFIRLQGCDVGCPWCDTKHTWPVDPLKKVGTDEIINKEKDSDTYAIFTVKHLADICDMHHARHVVITGGEPCAYDLYPLTLELSNRGKTVQIETSGTQEIKVCGLTFVTVSPKIDMPGGKPVLLEAMARANEIKMPVGKLADVQKLQSILKAAAGVSSTNFGEPPTVWLQPLSQNEKATSLCVEQATLHGWRISIQTHKYLGVR